VRYALRPQISFLMVAAACHRKSDNESSIAVSSCMASEQIGA
jgi:hypothetical protein